MEAECKKKKKVSASAASSLTSTSTYVPDGSGIEKRGVNINIFPAVRSLALSINPDIDFWSIGRVSALINGNHPIVDGE